MPWAALGLVPLLAAASTQPVCSPGREFWSPDVSACLPCTSCAPAFTLSPCAVHKDAVCGPLSALELDWSFLASRKRERTDADGIEAVTSKMLLRFPERDAGLRKVGFGIGIGAGVELTDGLEGNEEQRSRRKSTLDERSWDWETGALVLAVCACILFFLVAGCSALVYARQWRRMKKNFEPAGLEEISARLNLMVKAELAELVAGAPINPGDPETRCQYLEKLLDRKREAPMMLGWPEVSGNLYIEEAEVPARKKFQIARIHRNIETILAHTRPSTE